MKKFLAILLCAIMLLPANPITVGAETYNDLTYEKYDDHIEITGCDTKAVSVNIPAEIDGLPVTEIGDFAFAYCGKLTNVTIPSSVISIDYMAFYGTAYYNDGSNWQDGVLYIDHCLIEAKGDELPLNYAINNGTRVIADSAFDDCTGLTNVTIPSSVTSIGGGAFAGCTGLTNVTIPDNVTSIGSEAFWGCESLTNVTISGSVTSIGGGAFLDCGSLNITVDENNPNYSDIDGVLVNKDKTEIIVYAKDEIQSEYSIPSSVTSVGSYAFYDCDSLTSVTIPNGVTSIGSGAFYDCDSLTSVTIPNGVTSIGFRAFEYCDGLTSVTIPSSVISIGYNAFYSCYSLTDVYYTGSEEQWQNIIIEDYNYSLTGATIYYNSESLPRIEVPKPVVEGGSITITAEIKNIDGEGELFAVGYDGSKLTASEKLQDGAATLPAEDVKTIKVFCWDSLDTMRPLCEPKTITIK